MNTGMIKIELGNVMGFRQRCTLCGSMTEKCEVQATAHVTADFGPCIIRVCPECIKAGPDMIEWRIRKAIASHESWIAFLQSLIGRVELPTFAEWQAHGEKLSHQ